MYSPAFMKKVGDSLEFSATDLVGYLNYRHLTVLDRAVARHGHSQLVKHLASHLETARGRALDRLATSEAPRATEALHNLAVLQGALTAVREQIENHGLGQGNETRTV
jgi:hypothetical protein